MKTIFAFFLCIGVYISSLYSQKPAQSALDSLWQLANSRNYFDDYVDSVENLQAWPFNIANDEGKGIRDMRALMRHITWNGRKILRKGETRLQFFGFTWEKDSLFFYKTEGLWLIKLNYLDIRRSKYYLKNKVKYIIYNQPFRGARSPINEQLYFPRHRYAVTQKYYLQYDLLDTLNTFPLEFFPSDLNNPSFFGVLYPNTQYYTISHWRYGINCVVLNKKVHAKDEYSAMRSKKKFTLILPTPTVYFSEKEWRFEYRTAQAKCRNQRRIRINGTYNVRVIFE